MNSRTEGNVFAIKFESWKRSLPRLLDAAGAAKVFSKNTRILIKPNLVEALEPPITTPVELVSGLIQYIKERTSGAEIIVGEGSGSREYETQHAFNELGYTSMALEKEVRLVDLNKEPLVRLSRPDCKRWPEFYLPKIILDSFLVSVPVLKAHTLSSVTLTMKNLIGCAPPGYYQQGGFWKKASFHNQIHEAILDLNRYRTPDFTVLDATVGMAQAHLYGPTCDPPPNLLIAGSDPVAVDAYGAEILNHNWRSVGHIAMAHGELGRAEPLNVINV